MKKMLHPYCSKAAHNIALLILRVCLGVIMAFGHGYQKLTHFNEIASNGFHDFLGLGSQISLGLATFAEFFCAIFIILGLFTRYAVIPLIILFLVIVVKVHGLDIFDTAEKPFVLLAGYVAILFLGPGKISIDGLISRR